MSVNSVDPITGELTRSDGIPLDALPAATDTPVDADLVAVTEGGSWVKKTFAKLWEYISGKIQADSDILSKLHPVGTIIESTTCDTMAKVVAAYGGTTWKQHTGYVLRGASSGVVADSNVKTGGSDDAIVVKHSHTTPNHTHTFTGTAANYNSGTISADHTHTGVAGADGAHEHAVTTPTGHTWGAYFGTLQGGVTFAMQPAGVNGGCYYADFLRARAGEVNINSAHSHGVSTYGVTANHYHTTTVTPYGSIGNANPTTNETGSAGTNANIPNYKSVYIWERTA